MVSENLITTKDIAEKYNSTKEIVGITLSVLGWTMKTETGWTITDKGKQLGGIAKSYMGHDYVSWPESIMTNVELIASLSHEIPEIETKQTTFKTNIPKPLNDFRSKFPAKLRTRDGHFVRSRAEVIIDDWLYSAEIVHAYERKIPIEEIVYCDFYLPSGRIYIEYWGFTDNPQYTKRKQDKIDIYRKYELNLVELNDSIINSLDDTFPRLLLKYGITCHNL